MTKEPFHPFDLDDKLERIAHAKGVPTLTTEPAGAHAAPARPYHPEEGAHQAFPHHPAHTAPTEPSPPEPPAPEHPTVERLPARLKIPEYLMMELKLEAVRRRVSLTHLFLAGLKATGFTVRDEDMIEDGRRLRGKNSPPHSNIPP